MAKKTTAAKAAPAKEIVTPQPEVIEPKIMKPSWEIKDRVYILLGPNKPLSRSIKATNIFYFDEEKGYERELKNTSNQKTPFVDEMQGDQRLEHIVFRNGFLFVPKNKQTLQKLLSLYHPHRDALYEEVNKVREAETELDTLELEVESMSVAKTLDIDMAEAIVRINVGSDVSKMSSKELRRDLLLFAKNDPVLFLELVNDDNIQLRNIGIKAMEARIISLSQDQRTISWASTGKKLMTVPFDENPYSALAAWFKTDEGVEVFSTIEKRLK